MNDDEGLMRELFICQQNFKAARHDWRNGEIKVKPAAKKKLKNQKSENLTLARQKFLRVR